MIELLHDPRLWTSVSLVIFVIIFGKKLWKAISTVLDNRISSIRDDLNEAADLRREAEKLLEEANIQMGRAQVEAARLIKESEEAARNITKKAEEAMLAQTKIQEEQAAKQITILRQKAVANFSDEAIKLALKSVEDFLSKEIDSSTALKNKVLEDSQDELTKALKGKL